MLRASDLQVTFNPGSPIENHVLRGLTLDIPAGQFVTVIGSNGAGKSTFLNAVSGDLLVDSGRADVFVMDGSLLAGLVARSKNPADFKIVGEVLSVEPIAIMMRKDDDGLRKSVNTTIANLIKSGDMDKLYDKWFMQPTPPTGAKVGLAMSDSLKDALKSPNDKPMEDYAKK